MKSNRKVIAEKKVLEIETLTYCKRENRRKETYPI